MNAIRIILLILFINISLLYKPALGQLITVGFSKPDSKRSDSCTTSCGDESPAPCPLAAMSPHGYLPIRDLEYTSLYGWRLHPILGVEKMHAGVDLRAFYEPVFAFGAGTVDQAGYDHSAGFYIVLSHGTGKLQSVYAHLSFIGVRVGEQVKGGQCIGVSGESGLATAPHLHFGLKYDGRFLDPRDVLQALIGEKLNRKAGLEILGGR